MPLAPHGSLYALLHHGSGGGGGSSGIGSGSDPSEASRGGSRHGGVLRRGISRSGSVLSHSVVGSSSQAAGSGGGGRSDGNGCDGTGGRGRSRLSAVEKAAMAFDIARGMLHLHDNGFLHGALKSKNVLVSRWMGECLEVFVEVIRFRTRNLIDFFEKLIMAFYFYPYDNLLL